MLKLHGARRGLRALALLFSGMLSLGVFAAVTASPAAAAQSTQPTVAQLGASYLANQIVANGGSIGPANNPDPTDTAYAVIGLRAAKIGDTASNEAMTFLKQHITTALQSGGVDAPGAIAEYILASTASGGDPHHFGGTAAQNDLVARLLATQRTSGPDAGLFGTQDPTYDGAYREGLSLAALKAASVTASDPHVKSAITWLKTQQCSNGLWESYRSNTNTPCDPADPNTFTGPDTNSSAMATQGLAAWSTWPLKAQTIKTLHTVQSSDGGFPFLAAGGQSSDPNSTALVIQMLVALESDPTSSTWKIPGGTPLEALASYQLACSDPSEDRGAFFYPGDRSPNIFATVQAVPAAALKALPVPWTTQLGNPVAATCHPK